MVGSSAASIRRLDKDEHSRSVMANLFNRRTTLRAGMFAAAATPVTAGIAAADVGITAFRLRWSPDPGKDGLRAFVGVEDDRADSHPGVTHIFAEPAQYRFVMHRSDRDGSDRQRQEVRAIAANGSRIDMKKNETWRYNYQMFIPASLKATTSFTHIFQVKHTSVASPVVTMSLNRSGSSERVEMRMFGEGQAKLGVTDLAPLRNKWIDVEIEIKVADGSAGRLRYSLKDGGTTVVNASRSGIDTWLGGDQAHPKWGIYRSLSDSGQLQDTYLLLRAMQAYRDE
jgi:chitin-binding protein